MSESVSQALTKKKSKKRRKGKNGKVESTVSDTTSDQHESKMPKQVTEREEDHVITTSKCSCCKGTFRQISSESDMSPLQSGSWNCPSCVQKIKSEGTSATVVNSAHPPDAAGGKENALVTSGCNCTACVAKRENCVSPEVERDAHITQTYWMEIRHVVRCIYRENMSLTNQNKKSSIGSDKMRMIVKKLCSRDPHQFFQRLETLAREYLLEVKVRLLEQLSCGFNSPQLAIEFIQMLLEEYNTLCNALPALLYLLKPLENCEYVQRLGMTIELMNKNIFRELIFAESFMSSNLPLIIAQLRLASLADHFHRTTAEELNQRYIALDHEMEEICQIWKSAKDHLTNHQFEHRKSHFDRIKADGESFKQQVMLQHSNRSQDCEDSSESQQQGSQRCVSSDASSTAVSKTSHSTYSSVVKTMDKPYSNCNGVVNPGPIHKLLQSQMNDNDITNDLECNYKQAGQWARLLFKCIKPNTDTDFSLSGDVATHTITLHLDMTQLDLEEAKPCCAHADLIKYRRLGLSVEEIVEVAMKLSSLRSLGLNIKIEDLFDAEGFSLSDINVNGNEGTHKDDMYDGDELLGFDHGQGLLSLSLDEEIDLQKAKESILRRHDINGQPLLLNAKTRQQDFLRGLTMKIRFRKTLSVDDLDKHFIADDGKVTFDLCDQVQMKLTHMEMNSACLLTCCNAVGDILGLEAGPIHFHCDPLPNVQKNPKDYVFVHTNSHREFMDLLLKKRKQLEDTIISNEQERRNSWVQRNCDDDVKSGYNRKNESLPRYQVKEQQESSPDDPKETRRGLLSNFKPFFYSQDSQPCQCSACVGAMATIITSTFQTMTISDPSPASLSIQCSLSTHLGVDSKQQSAVDDVSLTGGKAPHLNGATNTSSSCTSPISKEGLWHNWMSTSGSAQLENESHVENSHHHYHHHNGAHCCHCGEKSDTTCDKLKVCNYHELDPSSSNSSCIGCSTTSVCNNLHGSTNPLSGAANGTSSGSGESARRYCPCCYCELFGHNVPPTAPTSHNYTKRRDIMRQKLEEKKKKKKEPKSDHPNYEKDEEQQTSVEELLAFIEGGDGEECEQSMATKVSRRQKKKQKKLQISNVAYEERNINDDSECCLFHRIHCESVEDCDRMPENDCLGDHLGFTGNDSKINHSKQSKQSQSMLGRIKSGGKSHERKNVESADVDEYDDELEEFKKFCFADAPTGPRKKIAVALNMHDIMSKLSS